MLSSDVARRLSASADQLWANTGLKPSQFSAPVLGLIFLRYAEKRFAEVEARIGPVGSGNRRKISRADYDAEGVIFLRPEARFSHLQSLTESDDIGKAVNEAMKAIVNGGVKTGHASAQNQASGRAPMRHGARLPHSWRVPWRIGPQGQSCGG